MVPAPAITASACVRRLWKIWRSVSLEIARVRPSTAALPSAVATMFSARYGRPAGAFSPQQRPEIASAGSSPVGSGWIRCSAMRPGTVRDESVSRWRLKGLGGQQRCRNRYCVTPRRLIEPARLAGTSLLRTQSDARLVDLVRAGHDSAFEAIVQRYRKPLLGYCSRLLPASRAEDAVQQTFLKAYQSMMSGDAELRLRPWLYKIAHNSSLNLLRQNGWSHEQLDENMDGVQRPDQALELRERLRTTVAAVNALPERQRDAVLLREIDGMSYEEIAVALGVGDGAVRQLLHRARATLRAGLTAVTPVGLSERLATALAGTVGDPSARVAEAASGFGLGAGALKVGAAVLATSAIATGVVTVPLVKHHRHSTTGAVDAAAAPPIKVATGSAPAAGPTIQVDDRAGPSHPAGTPG